MEDAKAPQPAKDSTPWYQALSGWGALIASLAAVGGLVFTGLSVRYQADQTKLQTAASNAQTDQQNKQQAQLVNIWPTSEFTSDRIIVTVSNRSEDPIYEFRIYVALSTSSSHGYLAISTWSSFPPCSQVTFNLLAIAGSYVQTVNLMNPAKPVPRFDYGIMFMDATGQDWHRHASGTLHATPWLEYLTGNHSYTPLLPPVFRSFTPLHADNFTTPEVGQKFVVTAPTAANACDQSG
jgi:hypothetical protein